jgi:septum formation protein
VQLVLASASPRRAELLRAAGFTFDVIVADVDESIHPGEAAEKYVRRLAAEKSAAGLKACAMSGVVSAFRQTDAGRATASGPAKAGHYIDTVVLGADTAVVVDGDILGKPRDDDDAARMLRRLSGRTHQVMTGISLRRGPLELGRVETTAVRFAALSNADVSWYVASGEGRDKAGAYAIQGLASRFIPGIDGSYANVVGLPVAAVLELLGEVAR